MLNSERVVREVPVLRGQVVAPEDPGYDQARQAWNLAADQRPAFVVFPETADVFFDPIRVNLIRTAMDLLF